MLKQVKADIEKALQTPTRNPKDKMKKLLEIARLKMVDQLEKFLERSNEKSGKLMQVRGMKSAYQENVTEAVEKALREKTDEKGILEKYKIS